jgi:hypothetical protein
MKQVKLIDKWGIVINGDAYLAPELRTQSLVGINPDGKTIKTSRIVGKCRGLIATNNSLYMLGEPDSEYETLYPNAKQRVFDSLEEIEV